MKPMASARIQIGGAGGAPANNLIKSLREAGLGDHLIGQSSAPADLLLADVEEAHLVPPAAAPAYEQVALELLVVTRPDLLLVQHDFEVRAVSRLRDKIEALGVVVPLPLPETVEIMRVDKHRSYEIWSAHGLPVPETALLRDRPETWSLAIDRLGPEALGRAPPRWRRTRRDHDRLGDVLDAPGSSVSTAGEALRQPAFSAVTASRGSRSGGGRARRSSTRRRYEWAFADRSPTGVTGVTRIAKRDCG